jgi:4-diphosphocytidyl-2-C-methyl-D-erythritol kinase
LSLQALYDVPAPAKLNLFLHVIGRRDDGYHLLQSPFVLIDWCDSLHFERRSDGQLSRRDLGPTLPADDLSLRAARALQAASASPLGADIQVDKRVPWGAGMGGGSSDAATTLLALNRLWGLHWPRERLQALGLTLGADVPFFIGGYSAWVEGVGERLTALRCPPQRFAVLKPAVSLPTRQIFEHHLMVRDSEAATLEGSRDEAGLVALPQHWLEGYGRNDLQAAAQGCSAEVAQAAAWLARRFGNSRMTGSGSALFARVDGKVGSESGFEFAVGASPGTGTELARCSASTGFPAADWQPGWLGRMCSSLSEHPLRSWAD